MAADPTGLGAAVTVAGVVAGTVGGMAAFISADRIGPIMIHISGIRIFTGRIRTIIMRIRRITRRLRRRRHPDRHHPCRVGISATTRRGITPMCNPARADGRRFPLFRLMRRHLHPSRLPRAELPDKFALHRDRTA